MNLYEQAVKLEQMLNENNYPSKTFSFDSSASGTKQELMNRVVAATLGQHVLRATDPVNTTFFVKHSSNVFLMLNFHYLPVRRAKAFFGDWVIMYPSGTASFPNTFSSAVPTTVETYVSTMQNQNYWRLGLNHYHRTMTPMFSIMDTIENQPGK